MKKIVLLMTIVGIVACANATVIFSESFEDPDITGQVQDQPTGWAQPAGHPDYIGLIDVDTGNFTTPYGSQALSAYTASPWAYAETTADILSETLTAGMDYTLTFNIAALGSLGEYRAALVAVAADDTVTELALVVGDNDGTNDMSYSDGLTFTPDGSHDALLGQRIAIQIGMDPDRSSWQNKPAWDNVQLDITAADVDTALPTVDAGSDWISWSAESFTLDDISVINNSESDLVYSWTADAPAGVTVDFSATDVEAPTVTITKPEGNMVTVTLTLASNYVGSTSPDVVDTMTVDVYDDSCQAAAALGPVAIDPTDFDGDCDTDLEDFAELAYLWMLDYSLSEPTVK